MEMWGIWGKWKLKKLCMGLLALALVSSCGKKSASEDSEKQVDAPTDVVAKTVVGVLNLSGGVSPYGTSDCGGVTGYSGDSTYGCTGSCSGSTYLLTCKGQGTKSFGCGTSQVSLTNGQLNGTADLSKLSWSGMSPMGSSNFNVSLKGQVASDSVTGALDCNFPAKLTFSSATAIPAIQLDCTQFQCSFAQIPVSCQDLQSKLSVDLCEKTQ